jgi:hypothetical protein
MMQVYNTLDERVVADSLTDPGLLGTNRSDKLRQPELRDYSPAIGTHALAML